jgi:hypothetical protein
VIVLYCSYQEFKDLKAAWGFDKVIVVESSERFVAVGEKQNDLHVAVFEGAERPATFDTDFPPAGVKAVSDLNFL